MATRKRTREVLIDTAKLSASAWKNIPAGFRICDLWVHPKTAASIALFEVPKGKGVPVRHTHASNQFMFCLKGEYRYTSTGLTLKPGMFYMNPKGHPHGPAIALKDSLLLELYDGPHYFKRPSYHSAETVGSIAGKKVKKSARKAVKKAAKKSPRSR
jgi:2,4'-dihydroxyacetophenone dioxygenase